VSTRYTILTFNFGDYDCIREPQALDPNASYLVVTDKAQKSDSAWTFINDKDLEGRDPIYSSFYVRFHPFKYTRDDIVIVIDGSIQLKRDLHSIVTEFEKSESSFSLMLGNFPSDREKISAWIHANRIDRLTANKLKAFMTKYDYDGLSSLGNAFRMFKHTKNSERFNKHCWRCALALGTEGSPIRLDDVISSTLASTVYRDESIFLVSTQLLRSSFMDYRKHRSTESGALVFHKHMQFRGSTADVHFFDGRMKPEYEHKVEAMLITKYLNPEDLEEWLDWHLDKLGFDYVHIFDNESNYDVQAVIAKYGDRITYEKVSGTPRQYKLYDDYANNRARSEWIMPIDDDEYFYTDLGTVHDAIDYYMKKFPHAMMLGVRWKHLFPKSFKQERTGRVLDYCTESDPRLASTFSPLGDRGIKTLVRRYGETHYEETWENPAGGHVPKKENFKGAVMCDGSIVHGCGIRTKEDSLMDEHIRLLHCRYKGQSDWKYKYQNDDQSKNCLTISDKAHREKNFKFNEILKDLE